MLLALDLARATAVGQRFGRLVVISEAEPVLRLRGGRPTKRRRVLCQCDCGQSCVSFLGGLRQGRTQSCGCRQRELLAKRATTHGEAAKKTGEWCSWRAMKARCYNSRNNAFHHYGGRGIVVCAAWRNDFSAFLAAVGRAPSPKHSIDRYPDVNGNYEPGNVRWATQSEQTKNRRKVGSLSHFSTDELLEELKRRQDKAEAQP